MRAVGVKTAGRPKREGCGAGGGEAEGREDRGTGGASGWVGMRKGGGKGGDTKSEGRKGGRRRYGMKRI